MWRYRQAPPTQAQVQQTATPQPANSQTARLSDDKSQERVSTEIKQKSANSAATAGAIASAKRPQSDAAKSSATTIDRQGFVAMMLCDPLICSGDEQVIRMELPGNAAGSADGSSEPVLADVVVGDDGLVRAMRIVNQ